MGFKDMVDAANRKVFLDTDKFGDIRTVKYDKETYEDIPVILVGIKLKDRRKIIMQEGKRDNTQGYYEATAILRCALSDIGGKKPKQGQRIQINNEEGGGGFFKKFTVASSDCSMGMLRLELEAIDE